MKRETVVIRTPFIKLDSFLKFCGAAGTGGTAKELIAQGLVSVDGDPCGQRGKKIYPGMLVAFDQIEYEVVSGED